MNIALNKPVKVSSSSETGGWTRECLVDGIRTGDPLKKGWSSALGIKAGSRARCNEWAEIDTGAIYRINRVDLYPANDTGETGDGFPVDFRIQVSEDEVVWADVVIKTEYEKSEDYAQSFSFTPVNARYVRITGTNLPVIGTDTLMRLAEIEVYGVTPDTTLRANIIMTADDSCVLYVNGTQAGAGFARTTAKSIDTVFNPGTNVIAVEAGNTGEYGGLLGQITIDGKMFFVTNDLWKINSSGPAGWNTVDFDDSTWEYAADHGPYGKFPWKYDIPEMPKDSLARWIWNSNEKHAEKQYFRFTINIDSATGTVTARQPPARTPPSPRTLILPAAAPDPLWRLAENGVSNAVIVKSPNADTVENFAATELQSYLGKITGANPSIVTAMEETKVNILLGTPSSSVDMANVLNSIGVIITSTSHGYDGYIIKTVNCPGKKIILITGYKPRAVLFGAYRLLENLGCRFYGPKTVPSNEIVPYLPNLSAGNIDDARIPVTKFRMMSNGNFYASDTATLEKIADWIIKNGYNSILLTLRLKDPGGNLYHPWEPYDPTPLTKRGIEIMMAGHNWAGFVDNATKTWYTSEENIQTFLNNVKAYALGHPEASAIGAWQMDGPRGKIRIERDGQVWRFTEWNLYVMNRIAEMFRAEGIGQRVMWMTYVESNRPPNYMLPDPLLDIYYYHQFQNYQEPLNSAAGDKPVDWSLNDFYRRPQNSDWADEPIPDSLLAQRPVVNTWNKYLTEINFCGDAVLVDHISAGIGNALKYPALSYTNLGPVYSLEDDRRYEREQGFNGYTNCFGCSDFSDNLTPVSPDPYLHRRMAETLWDDTAGRDALDSDYYIHYYGIKYAERIMRFFDRVYFEASAGKRDYHSVKNIMGDLYTEISSLKNTMINDSDTTAIQKARIEMVCNWYNRRVIPYKLQYYNRGNLSPGIDY